tara:strand:+ start:6757 stop:7179 length:423 start_codon:yes stop_codon:yes gene_type:complete
MNEAHPDYANISGRVTAWFVANRYEFFRTGSHVFFGTGADMDYLVDFNDLPDHIREDLVAIHDYAGERYPDAFINIKDDDSSDFIIQKSPDYYCAWRYATNKLRGQCVYGSREREKLMSDKEYRVEVFESYKEQYLNKLA